MARYRLRVLFEEDIELQNSMDYGDTLLRSMLQSMNNVGYQDKNGNWKRLQPPVQILLQQYRTVPDKVIDAMTE